MVTPLEKFRVQYPTAALITDLVSIHDGQYIVRTAVIDQGETLATGLAASVDIQIAEDRARARAIAPLGISRDAPADRLPDVSVGSRPDPTPSLSPEPNVQPEAQPKTELKAQPDFELKAQPDFELKAQPDFELKAQPKIESEAQPDFELSFESDTQANFETGAVPSPPPEEDFGPPIDAIAKRHTPEASAPATAAKQSAATIALESFSTSASPVDLSDVIAQTDVELARLGWSNAQGREYLEKTYGKRSRQQLTDEELMSFLLYLEDQLKK